VLAVLDVVCVTAPFDPGLLMRTEIEMFDGVVCEDWACEPVFCWPSEPAAPLVETEIVCETSLLSPGLPMRTDTEMFVAPLAAAAAAASTSADGSGEATSATVDVSGAPGVSACAGCAKPNAAAMTAAPMPAARPRDQVKRMAVPPRRCRFT
jgi:hypothetical protein